MTLQHNTSRRTFLKQAALTGGIIGTTGFSGFAAPARQNAVQHVLPKWKGFNLLDFFSPDPERPSAVSKEDDFRWMADWGFDFVRIPMAYPSYLKFDRQRDITADEVYSLDERALEKVDRLIEMAHKYGLHVSLNLHRAPGYCINAGFHEPFNLWKEKAAQEAFYWHWAMWAKRYRHFSREKISFDLLNEPAMIEDMNNQHAPKTLVPGDLYASVASYAAKAIWKENPDHLVIADGNQVGTKVIPELTHLPIAQSCRGYYPSIISHYKAPWAMKDIENLPELSYPGQVGDQYLSRQMLEEFYAPWIELAKGGTGVHCGECGCYNKTPHNIFLAWFGDVIDILSEHNIGFGLWNFRGAFGILDSGRKDVDYVDWYGHQLDSRLLKLLQKA